jgi:PRC-barrel domain
MSRLPGISTLAVLAALTATPVFAQQQSASPATPGAPTSAAPAAVVPPAGPGAPTAATAGRLQQTHGGWRSSRIVGATVYNDSNQDIGTVDDLIVGRDGKISTAVISVGGFLGIGSKLVGVPYDQLRFEERSPNETAAAANAPSGTAPTAALGTGAGGVPAGMVTAGTAPSPAVPGPNVATARVVLPGASKDSLTSMPTFNYGT